LVNLTLFEIIGWVLIAGMGVVLATQALGRTPLPVVFAAQALTPYMLPVAIVLVVVAAATGSLGMAIAAAFVAIGVGWLMTPIVFRPRRQLLDTGGPTLTVAHANVLLDNARPVDAARVLFELDADVLSLTEHMMTIREQLLALGIERTHPHRLERVPGDRDGIALFSRYPITGQLREIGHQLAIEATIDHHGVPIDVLVVHPLPGLNRNWLRRWRDDMASIERAATSTGRPTVVVGDFNASRWHPAFRRILHGELVDAHEQLGRAFSVSWPTRGPMPAFVRLDHALVSRGLVATAIDDVTVPGSDHRGFVVTVAVA
jgi:endonuclease/exonuclease/phosphatase (EEP) superfamily protein YafD